MKRRRIKIRLGDVFLAPFEPKKAKYSDVWDSLWEPEENESVFVMQIVGFSNLGFAFLALFDAKYSYKSTLYQTVDVSKMKVLAITHIIPLSLTAGEFLKIDNQLIPNDMPYMAYEIYSLGVRHISPSSMSRVMLKSNLGLGLLPRFGSTATGGLMYAIAEILLLKLEGSGYAKREIDRFRVRPEAEVWRYFPEAKNNPQWTIEQMKVER